jgi:hypothetical protein
MMLSGDMSRLRGTFPGLFPSKTHIIFRLASPSPSSKCPFDACETANAISCYCNAAQKVLHVQAPRTFPCYAIPKPHCSALQQEF